MSKRSNSKPRSRDPISDEQWDRWKLRIVGAVMSLLGLVTLAMQLLVVEVPTETRIFAALGLLGLGPLIGSLDKKGDG